MLINPNLSTKSEFNKNNIEVYKNSLEFSFIDENTIKIKKKKGFEFGLIYVNLFDEFTIGSKVAFSGKFELIKGQNARIYFNGFNTSNLLVSEIGVNRIEAIGDKNNSYNQAQVRIFHDDEVVFRFTEMKLEKDEVTPYIPNENTLEMAKRQYFIGGGTFKEVYPD
ncbi:hypothetical protein NH288_05365 [Anaerococcus sp. NML200537]|uniref:hypothetical protein n=1 Tax=Anaerococcus sp. NML200537 TaxID=2954485 RepID=UPI0022371345|nr:hypothetical protein [Anaerococcus sp. NML200537]MCW6701512.1 hypothetical protein [Anaerococcus sp. NML200537]